MTPTDDLTPTRAPGAPAREPSPGAIPPGGRPLGVRPGSRREVLARRPVVLSQAVRWTNRRRTRAAAVLALLLASAVVIAVVLGATRESQTALERTTAEAWSATRALSDGLRALEPGDRISPLREEARAARAAVREAGVAVKGLDLGGAQASVQRRTIRALRADDAWIDAVGSTLANPRSERRADLSRLARNAAVRTARIVDDVRGARDTVGGTGRLLSATRPR